MTAPIFMLASALPRLDGEDADATGSILAALGGLPRRAEAVVPGLGAVTISLMGPSTGSSRAPDGPSIGLGRGSERGRLSLDGSLAGRLVARTLGVEMEGAPSVRRMGLGERGLLAGLVAAFLHERRVPLSVSVTSLEGAEVRAHHRVILDLAVDVGGATGFVRLEVPPAWLAEVPPTDETRARLASLSVEVCVERARTCLPARALEDLEEGDAVVFEGERAESGADEAWSARLVLGAYAARADVRVDGHVVVREEFRRLAAETSPPGPVTARETNTDAIETKGGDETAVLAAAPLEVIAELGRIALRGDEVLGLAPGVVLMLGAARATRVVLRVAGEVWAEGELVDVDGELGVRVTKSFRR
ncbi:MAG: Type secretion inner rane protein [Myxococcales bacterium]|nr:Type secretion inner rane protein [Myxococcales bacterium]